MPNEDSNSVDVTTNLNDSSDTVRGVKGIQKAKPTKKNYNKLIKILGLITLIPLTALGLDSIFNGDKTLEIESDNMETKYALTPNCWTNIILNIETGKVLQLELDCNKGTELEEFRDAVTGVREKTEELGMKFSMPFSTDQLYDSVMSKYEVDDTI